MKNIFIYGVLLLASLQLVACGSTYKVATTTGDVFYSDGRPDIDDDTNQVIFEDQNGDEVILEREKIQYIKESDLPEKE